MFVGPSCRCALPLALFKNLLPPWLKDRSLPFPPHTGVGGGEAQKHKDMPEESKQYLTEVERRDMEMVGVG